MPRVGSPVVVLVAGNCRRRAEQALEVIKCRRRVSPGHVVRTDECSGSVRRRSIEGCTRHSSANMPRRLAPATTIVVAWRQWKPRPRVGGDFTRPRRNWCWRSAMRWPPAASRNHCRSPQRYASLDEARCRVIRVCREHANRGGQRKPSAVFGRRGKCREVRSAEATTPAPDNFRRRLRSSRSDGDARDRCRGSVRGRYAPMTSRTGFDADRRSSGPPGWLAGDPTIDGRGAVTGARPTRCHASVAHHAPVPVGDDAVKPPQSKRYGRGGRAIRSN